MYTHDMTGGKNMPMGSPKYGDSDQSSTPTAPGHVTLPDMETLAWEKNLRRCIERVLHVLLPRYRLARGTMKGRWS